MTDEKYNDVKYKFDSGMDTGAVTEIQNTVKAFVAAVASGKIASDVSLPVLTVRITDMDELLPNCWAVLEQPKWSRVGCRNIVPFSTRKGTS